MTFQELKIIEPIVKALEEKGYRAPTYIQKKLIPSIYKRKDLFAIAKSGTGKTAAYAIPLIQLIHLIDGKSDNKPVVRSLVLVPTSEAAQQVQDNFKYLAKNTKVKFSTLIEGELAAAEDALSDGVHILIAQPEAFSEAVKQGKVDPKEVKVLVLDYADAMINIKESAVLEVLKLLPEKRQTLIFANEAEQKISDFSKKHQNNPDFIKSKSPEKKNKRKKDPKKQQSRSDNKPKNKDNSNKSDKSDKSKKPKKKKKFGGGRKNTEMSAKLKAKFLWPLEK